MTELLLHDNPASSNAQKVRLLLEVLGLRYRRRLVPFEKPRPERHCQLNPTGGIPVLIDGPLILAESQAILRYLACRERRWDIYPPRLSDRARVEWLLDAISSTLRPSLRAVEEAAFGLRRGRGLFAEGAKPGLAKTELDRQTPALERFSNLLDPDRGWACLGRMTLVDVAAAPSLHRLRAAGLELDQLPRLAQWAATVLAAPAWKPIANDSGLSARTS